MLRLSLWGVTSIKGELVDQLHELGVLHTELAPAEVISREESHRLVLLSARIRGMLEALSWDDWDSLSDDYLRRVEARIGSLGAGAARELERSLESFRERLSELLEERDSLQRTLQTLRQVHHNVVHVLPFFQEERTEGRDLSLWWVGSSRVKTLLPRLRSAVQREGSKRGERASVRYHKAAVSGENVLLSLSVPREARGEVEEVMREEDAVAWRPPHAFEKRHVFDSIQAVEKGMDWVPKRLKEVEGELDKTRREWGPRLGALYILTEEQAEAARLEDTIVPEGGMFQLEGWIPEDHLEEATKALKCRFQDELFIYWRHPESDEWHEVPVALINPAPFRPFELFLRLLPSPRYMGVDPTILMGIFFPFFSGCMVGDAGYGAIIGVIGALLRKKGTRRRYVPEIGVILMHIAAWSVFWGFLYGELFGDLGHRLLGLHPLWVERAHAVMPVMIFTIVLGLGHILLGLLLGVVEGIRFGERSHWLEKLADLLIFLGLIALLVVIKGWLPPGLFSVALSFLIVGFVLLTVAGGVGGVVEMLGAVGNVLSYVRIAAIGLSSAILAMVASTFVDVLGISLLGLFLAVVLHLLNFVLALAGSGLHSARLHYVEFFGKFYSTGGTAYKPFSKRRKQ